MKGAKDLLDGAALAVLETPSRERLGHRIQIVDDALGIGGDDAVADALQRDLRALLLAKQRLLVQLALGDVEFDADQAQQPALVVDLGLGAADDPAPFAGGVAHAVQALENRRLARHVIADGGLHARHVVRMHQRAPVRRLPHVGFVVAQHRLPARRQIHAIVEGVEIPEAVVRAVQGQFVALFQVAQVALDLDALESGGKAAADQLHQQMQLHFPVLARQRAGDPEQAGRPALDEVADDQHRADAEVTPHRRILGLIGARLGGIAQLRHPQRREPRLQPGQRVQRLAAQLFRIAGGQHAARHLDFGELSGLGVERECERRCRCASLRAAVPDWRR